MSILILAGDLTNYYLYKKLKDNDFHVKLEGFSHLTGKFPPKGIKISGFKTIIAPIPLTIDGSSLYSPYSEESIYIDQLMSEADKDSKIIGGPFSRADKRIYDLTKNRSFTDLTVIPTCEEILKIIIDKSDITISKSYIEIVGDGRISRRLTTILKALGANAKIVLDLTENNSSIIIITAKGYKIDDEILKNKLVIDITNTKHSRKTGKNILKARGLPGKSAPKSVANYIFETLLKEEIIQA